VIEPRETAPGLTPIPHAVVQFPAREVGTDVTEPLGPLALIRQPAKLPGVERWSIETRKPRAGLTAAAYSPDGKYFALAGYDGSIRLYDAQSQKLVRIFSGHQSNAGFYEQSEERSIVKLMWTPDSRRLVSWRSASESHLWDVSSGKTLHIWWKDTNDVALSPDGQWIALSIRPAGTVQVCSTSTFETVRTIQGLAHPLAWSPDGNELAGKNPAEATGLIIANPQTGEVLRTLRGTEGDSLSLSMIDWLPDGKHVLATLHDKSVRVRNAMTGEESHALKHESPVHSLAWSPDRTRLACGTSYHSITLWNTETWTKDREIPGSAESFRLSWSPDGKTLLAANVAGARFFDVASGEKLSQVISIHPKYWPTWSMDHAWSPDGDRLALGADFGQGNGRLVVWNLRTGRREELHPDETYYPATGLAWSPDGQYLAAISHASTSVWDMNTRQRIQEFQARAGGYQSEVAWNRQGTRLLSLPIGEKTAQAWNPLTGEKLFDVPEQPDALFSAAWLADGDHFVTGGHAGGLLKRWNLDTKTEEISWRTTTHSMWAMSLTPDGKTLAVGDDSGVISLCDPETGKHIGKFQAENAGGHIVRLSWSPDAKMLTANVYDRTISSVHLHIWDMEERRLVRTLLNVGFGDVSFANGLFAGGEQGNTVRLYDLERHAGPTLWFFDGGFVQFSPDGHFHATPGAEAELVYVVQLADSQELLTREEFEAKFGWKNDPSKVDLTATKPVE
jgi:WD40 repeat protein